MNEDLSTGTSNSFVLRDTLIVLRTFQDSAINKHFAKLNLCHPGLVIFTSFEELSKFKAYKNFSNKNFHYLVVSFPEYDKPPTKDNPNPAPLSENTYH